MTREEAALALAQSYVKEFKKHSFKVFNPNKVQDTKWWNHFLRAADLRYLENWSPDIWVKCQFEKHGKIFPFRLYGKIATETFEEYKHRFLETEQKEVQIIKSMISTHKQLNDKELDVSTLLKIKRNFYSIHYLSIYKPFRELNKEQNIFDEDVLNVKRAYVYKNKKLLKKLKEILKDNLY